MDRKIDPMFGIDSKLTLMIWSILKLKIDSISLSRKREESKKVRTIHVTSSPNSTSSIGYPLQINDIGIQYCNSFSNRKHWKTFFQDLQQLTTISKMLKNFGTSLTVT